MSTFQIHTKETASEAGRAGLEATEKAFGFIPNAIAAMAEAPVAVDAYLALTKAVSSSSFSPEERTVVWFTLNTYHGCQYCMAAHTTIAQGEQVSPDVIQQGRAGGPYADARLEALRKFTLHLAEERGWADQSELDAFFAAGFTKQNVLEIVTAISHKVLSNYTNHLAETPLDEPFQANKWEPATAAV